MAVHITFPQFFRHFFRITQFRSFRPIIHRIIVRQDVAEYSSGILKVLFWAKLDIVISQFTLNVILGMCMKIVIFREWQGLGYQYLYQMYMYVPNLMRMPNNVNVITRYQKFFRMFGLQVQVHSVSNDRILQKCLVRVVRKRDLEKKQ